MKRRLEKMKRRRRKQQVRKKSHTHTYSTTHTTITRIIGHSARRGEMSRMPLSLLIPPTKASVFCPAKPQNSQTSNDSFLSLLSLQFIRGWT